MADGSSVDRLLKGLDHSPARFWPVEPIDGGKCSKRSGRVTVVLERGGGQGWGIVGGMSTDNGNFSIEEIKTSGLLAKWNRAHAEEAVAPGDRIISVNGVEPGDERFMELMRTASEMNILIERKNDLRARFRRMRSQDCKLIDESLIASAMGTPRCCDYAAEGEQWWQLLKFQAESDDECGAAVGLMLGLAIGDAVGHPLEFMSVEDKIPGVLPEDDWPCVFRELSEGSLSYRRALNRFMMKPGQWTDDTSMALCLADSILANYGYHGGDARLRWYNWWFHGYCNSFRFDDKRVDRCSVGLGGNVGESLREIKKWAADAAEPASSVPAIYSSGGDDAGNGSIMRLAPVAIGYHRSSRNAMEVAALQSRATHPGEEASVCCQFMAYFLTAAIAAHREATSSPNRNPRGFVSTCVEGFQKLHARHEGPAWARLRALLACSPPSPKEANWNWQQEELAVHEALAARRSDPTQRYNGHPIDPSYFGSYCMDGLAMALWAVWRSHDFASCILLAVNLLGDADTTGAITGQLAGAIYGWKGIVDDEWGRLCMSNLRKWDPLGEIGLRAVLLFHLTPLSPRLKAVEEAENATTLQRDDSKVQKDDTKVQKGDGKEPLPPAVQKVLSGLACKNMKKECKLSCEEVKTMLAGVSESERSEEIPLLTPSALDAILEAFMREAGLEGTDEVDVFDLFKWICK